MLDNFENFVFDLGVKMGDDKNTKYKNVFLHIYEFHFNHHFTNHQKNISKTRGNAAQIFSHTILFIEVKLRDCILFFSFRGVGVTVIAIALVL